MEQFAGKSEVRMMEEKAGTRESGELTAAQLGSLDTALGFLLILIAATLLSFAALSIQRKKLCLTLQGDEEGAAALPEVIPLRYRATVLVVGALGYFLCLSLQTAWKAARGEDLSARQTAWASLWAAILVFCSSVVRLEDLLRIAGADGDGGAAPADRPICDREV